VTDTRPFAAIVLWLSVAAVLAVLSNRLTARVRVPAPALFLAAGAVLVKVLPGVHTPSHRTVERVVTIALLCILFEGGMGIGVRRLRPAAGPVLVVGVVGTFLTTMAVATVVHLGFGFSWYIAALIGTAVAPTDPALVFSVLGGREIAGRSSTILEGEYGANDPVGIALLASLLGAGSLSGGAVATIAGQFLLQMAVGAVVGVAGGWALLVFIRRVSLPSEGLYPLRVSACALGLFGVATLTHGSGFLAGIVIGDEGAPFKREIERFHAALASLAEIVAFAVLGLTVDLGELTHRSVWIPGLVVGVLLAVVIRPVLVGVCLLPARLRRGEAAFVLFAGLKGAVPILLGSLILAARVPDAPRMYGIVIVVVAFSVLVQGSLVPTVVGALGLPARVLTPQPWALGVRLAAEPLGVLRLQVAPGSVAAGSTVDALIRAVTGPDQCDEVWVNLLVRDQALLAARSGTALQAGDEAVLSAEERWHSGLIAAFETPTDHGPASPSVAAGQVPLPESPA
jgi:cell volume regulation protein A